MNNCKEFVRGEGTWGSFHRHQCNRRAVKDGYCKQHHPDTVAERNEKRNKRYEVNRLKRRKEIYGAEMYESLQRVKKWMYSNGERYELYDEIRDLLKKVDDK